MVLANILAGPLRELKSVISAYCKPGGKLVLSGILDNQAEEINALYSEQFDMQPRRAGMHVGCVSCLEPNKMTVNHMFKKEMDEEKLDLQSTIKHLEQDVNILREVRAVFLTLCLS